MDGKENKKKKTKLKPDLLIPVKTVPINSSNKLISDSPFVLVNTSTNDNEVSIHLLF